MARADHATSTDGAAHLLPPIRQFTAIEAEHVRLVATLIGTKPHGIVGGWADAADVDERSRHIHDVLTAVNAYIDTVVRDTAQNTPIGDINYRDLTGLLIDAADDICGSLDLCRHKLETASPGSFCGGL